MAQEAGSDWGDGWDTAKSHTSSKTFWLPIWHLWLEKPLKKTIFF